jgi:hypothetical protein
MCPANLARWGAFATSLGFVAVVAPAVLLVVGGNCLASVRAATEKLMVVAPPAGCDRQQVVHQDQDTRHCSQIGSHLDIQLQPELPCQAAE